jgi:hypothetical protein
MVDKYCVVVSLKVLEEKVFVIDKTLTSLSRSSSLPMHGKKARSLLSKESCIGQLNILPC